MIPKDKKILDDYAKDVALIRKIFGGDEVVEDAPQPINTQPLFLLRQIWPEVIERLRMLLTETAEGPLASTISDLQVFDRCRCGQDDCATVYTKPWSDDRGRDYSEGVDAPSHRRRGVVFWHPDTICLDSGQKVGARTVTPVPHTTILDVVDEEITRIEIIGDGESAQKLIAALPDTPTQ